MDLTPLPWLQVQVELEGSVEIDCDPRPGRIVIVGPGHTFLQLAETIDDAFARWDLAHLSPARSATRRAGSTTARSRCSPPSARATASATRST